VLIPDGKRLTLCLSSQAGCRMGCGFCLTGKIGFKRDLLPHEIVDQFLQTRNAVYGNLPETITNIVFMGMGEPLDNLDNVAEAIKRITAFARFSKRRITVSTSGMAPGIQEFAAKAPGVKLAVSINAATDSVRSSIMPINRKYPLQKLIAALRDFPLAPRDRITIEYVLLKRVNDAQADAKALAGLLRGIPCKINLIPYNGPENCENGRAFNMPDENTTMAFQDVLVRAGYTAIVRKSKGKDILAACGQLAGKG
ncbi:MAG: 23S rRNA (adenine(2503)-C(2))-methyltransferase RlmN, partial [Nitrospiraceae bacterium]|nr:23S rRNA (adenine(2503)-C(2))-methyltransferase RlmN [Nitrospiraceae bacterium]